VSPPPAPHSFWGASFWGADSPETWRPSHRPVPDGLQTIPNSSHPTPPHERVAGTVKEAGGQLLEKECASDLPVTPLLADQGHEETLPQRSLPCSWLRHGEPLG